MIKKINPVFFLLLIAVLTGCKFTETPAGVYTGTYTKPSYWTDPDTLPVSAGNGTLTISDAGVDKVDVLFSSPGNPDVQFTNLDVDRYINSFQGNSFDITSADYDYYDDGCVGDVVNANMRVHFKNYDTLGFDFEGTRQE